MLSTVANLSESPFEFIVTVEPGTVVKEMQPGYMFGDRLLRPSLVGVSKKVTEKEEKTEENQEKSENK